MLINVYFLNPVFALANSDLSHCPIVPIVPN